MITTSLRNGPFGMTEESFLFHRTELGAIGVELKASANRSPTKEEVSSAYINDLRQDTSWVPVHPVRPAAGKTTDASGTGLLDLHDNSFTDKRHQPPFVTHRRETSSTAKASGATTSASRDIQIHEAGANSYPKGVYALALGTPPSNESCFSDTDVLRSNPIGVLVAAMDLHSLTRAGLVSFVSSLVGVCGLIPFLLASLFPITKRG